VASHIVKWCNGDYSQEGLERRYITFEQRGLSCPAQ
jgi:hypothetical protein